MSDAEWSSEVGELATPPKKRIPGWVWGCGAGCLLFLLLTVGVLAVGFTFVRKAVDQDAQWERLGAYLPVAERPPGVSIFGMPIRIEGMAMWVLMDEAHHRQGLFLQAPAGKDATQTRQELLASDQDKQLGGLFGGYGRNEVEKGTIEVQGRSLECLRYQSFPKEDSSESSSLSAVGAQFEGASMVVDLAPEGSGEVLLLILTKVRTSERVSDDELRAFLAPFQVPGGVRPPAPPPEPVQQPAEEGK